MHIYRMYIDLTEALVDRHAIIIANDIDYCWATIINGRQMYSTLVD